MPSNLIVPSLLLASIVFVLLTVLYRVVKALRYNHMLKSLASELTLHYIHPVVFRTPTVAGVYRGRQVVFEEAEGMMRVRAFHSGELDREFTIGTGEYFRGKGGGFKLDVGNDDFSGIYRVSGSNLSRIRKYLDSGLQMRLLAFRLSFTVGRHYVSASIDPAEADKTCLQKTADFLVEAAARADHLL